MMRTPVGSSPRELQSLLRDGIATGLTDQELLERFATCRDQSGELAFATLVARHGPMVMNVCRRMLRNPADADDAFQATFLVLVRRAGAIRFGTSLGPWLYGVSVRVARRARDQGSRRRVVELDENRPRRSRSSGSPVDRDLRLAVDEALARLPANFRAAIVSCYLEGLTHEEAAVRLRCPVGTIRSRLARGRALLRDRLERSGLRPDIRRCEPLAMLGLDRARIGRCLSSHRHHGPDRGATRGGPGTGRDRAGPACSISRGSILRTMTIFKFTLAASLVVFAGLAAWGAVVLAGQAPGGDRAGATARRGPAHPLLALAASRSLPAILPRKRKLSMKTVRISLSRRSPATYPRSSSTSNPASVPRMSIPGLREIRVTFSKKMRDKSWSWTEGNVYSVPKLDGKIHYEYDQRTCVMPVKLEPGKTYVLGINSERFRNFQGRRRTPGLAVPAGLSHQGSRSRRGICWQLSRSGARLAMTLTLMNDDRPRIGGAQTDEAFSEEDSDGNIAGHLRRSGRMRGWTVAAQSSAGTAQFRLIGP